MNNTTIRPYNNLPASESSNNTNGTLYLQGPRPGHQCVKPLIVQTAHKQGLRTGQQFFVTFII